MTKKNILIITALFIAITALRFFPININEGFLLEKITSVDSIYKIFLNNTYGFLNIWLNSLWNLPACTLIKPYLPLIFNIFGIIILFIIGLHYLSKKGQAGIITLALAGLSPFLIYLNNIDSLYSIVFFLSSLVILFSIKSVQNNNIYNNILLVISSVLLVLTYNPTLFFVLFNFIAIFVFLKKHKTPMNILLCFISVLILLSPCVPFAANLLSDKSFLGDFVVTLNINDTMAFFADIFSPRTLIGRDITFYNFGTILFVFIPTLIGIIFAIKSCLSSKREDWYMPALVLSTFFSMLLICFFGGVLFSTLYLTPLIVPLILIFSSGITNLKAQGVKSVFLAIYLGIIAVSIVSCYFPSILFF